MINENVAGWRVKWPAPAKLNLMLRIVGQRPDGYHLLQTVFQFIDLCDWLTFTPNDSGSIELQSLLSGVLEQEDLTVRAANLLSQSTGCKQGVTISVEKNLPMGGGLGGGSSDAATTLVVLNHLWQTQLSKQDLMALGLKLGADVPIFVHGSAAWAEGVGEEITDISIPEPWYVIIKPDCHVNTREIFSAKELTRNNIRIKIVDFTAGQKNNDCLPVVAGHYQQVKKALEDLSSLGEARLTGTGACVFAEFPSEVEAIAAQSKLKNKWQTFVAKGSNKSLLYSKLEQVI